MKIIRDGQEFQLTYNELCEAHKEFVINWMADAVNEELENSNLSNEMVRELAEYGRNDCKCTSGYGKSDC